MTGAPDTGALALIAGFLGGLGLFLLGMHLLTDGLRTAGGKALRQILGSWTRTRTRALATGAGVTALVQSSSAVTLAIIGFANAGLLTLGQSIWVIFGSNVGTTVTGWLVSIIGLEIRIEAFALPAIGLGALVFIIMRGPRLRYLGLALAGFGLLFLGIDVLRATFVDLGETVDLGALARPGFAGLVIMVSIGMLLTLAMQSSSASMAMALTAAMSGAIPLEAAAAAVIGSNLGTTIKAVLVVIGATANAKRVAAAHVIFNALTAVVALLMLPWFLAGIEWIWGGPETAPAPAMLLALFHTAFNVLGVILMIPLATPMIRRLQHHFGGADLDLARPRYLDDSSAGVPELALQSLVMEVDRAGDLAHRMARDALAETPPGEEGFRQRLDVVERLVEAIGEFANQAGRVPMADPAAEGIAEAVRVARYHQDTAARSAEIAELRRKAEDDTTPRMTSQRRAWQARVIRALDCARLEREEDQPDTTTGNMQDALEEVESAYQELKSALLREGTFGALSLAEMDRQLRIISLARRLASQAAKAHERGIALHGLAGNHH
ncbi:MULTISPECIES: Na/Pi cotransporter family protein [unclassified Thioalkalivibrio]|uniref:Na/Pi cotransporter family protein n=1 Tax=unclassified Thioalkalivibrio TaxID=2621013 RepID=UPI000371163A|nr:MULTISPECIES: Na/Pi symporter [unclassified Thioalkalivibrio]